MVLNALPRTGSGFSTISNVNVAGGGKKDDDQPGFLFVEVMKYSYMIQAGDTLWDVNADGTNHWVFNTEAYPFKVAGPSV